MKPGSAASALRPAQGRPEPGRGATGSGKTGAIGRPLAVLTLCFVIAGGGLAWFTVRAAMQERTIAEQEAREATSKAARLIAEAIVPQLEAIERRVPETDGADDRVILTLRDGRAIPTLPMRLLFDLQGPAAGEESAWPASGGEPAWRTASGGEPAWQAALRAAEAIELRARDCRGRLRRIGNCLPARPQIRGRRSTRARPPSRGCGWRRSSDWRGRCETPAAPTRRSMSCSSSSSNTQAIAALSSPPRGTTAARSCAPDTSPANSPPD